MFNKQTAVEQIIEVTKKQQIEELDKQVCALDEVLVLFSKQLEGLKQGLSDMDKVQKKQVEEILQQLPLGSSPESVLDGILKIATPKRTQLLDSIQKIRVSIEIEEGRKRKLLIEKRKIEQAVREEGLNELTGRVCGDLKDALDKYLAFEDSFINLKEKISEVAVLDKAFFNRVDSKKHPTLYVEMLGLSCMSPGTLPGLSPTDFVLNLQNLAPGKNPLGDPERQHLREKGKPIIRDIND